MKLRPKGVTFCPGCPKKELKMIHEPLFNVVLEKKQDTKTTTIIGAKPQKKRHFGLF